MGTIATFLVLSSHMWLVATETDSAEEGVPNIQERSVGQRWSGETWVLRRQETAQTDIKGSKVVALSSSVSILFLISEDKNN